MHEAFDFPELADAHAGQIHDGATGVNNRTLALFEGVADGQSFPEEFLIFDDKPLYLSLGRGDGVELVDIDFAQLLYVNRPTILTEDAHPFFSIGNRKEGHACAVHPTLSILW